MTSKERLDNFYSGKTADRLPNLTIVGSVVTRYSGINIETYCKNWKLMADSAILAAKDLELDFVQIASDLNRESEGYGSELLFFPDKLPNVKKYALSDVSEITNLKALKAKDIPRLFDLVTATKYVLDSCEDIYPMTLSVGPATIAGNMRGVENFMMDMYDYPEEINKLLDIVTDTIIDFIDELKKIGAKYVYIADPIASLVSPIMYEEMILPRHKKIFSHMKEIGIRSRLHMCGNTIAILPYSSTCGAEIIDIDYATPFDEALTIVNENCILNGNIDPVGDVYDCTAEHTENKILECAKIAGTKKAMFMPGCELPTNTPLENIKAIHSALCKISNK